MLHGYIVDVDKLSLSVDGGNPTVPLRLSANAFKKDGMPYGFVALNGLIHNALPEGLPSLIAYNDGGVEIRTQFDLKTLADARFVVSGSAMLVSEGKPMERKGSPLNLRYHDSIRRMGIGVFPSGRLLFVVHKCTVKELAYTMQSLGVHDAMLLAYENVFVENPRGGVMLNDVRPLTIFEATEYKELERPIYVLDPGHGGSDPGAVGLGLQEKDLNLAGALIVYKYLKENYHGTPILTRAEDKYVSLDDRCKLANVLDADYYFSNHSNAFDGYARGYESFTCQGAKRAKEIQEIVHKGTMKYLASLGAVDRGMKTANFQVLRSARKGGTKCPSVLVEHLFVDSPKDNAVLSDHNLFRGLYIAYAESLAKAMSLPQRVEEKPPETLSGLYRVQVGAFRFKKNAEELLAKLKEAGFDGIIKKDAD